MSDDRPAVKVSLDTIYETLLDVAKKVDPVPAQLSDHEVRIRAIEKYLWIWIGSAGATGAGLTQIANTLVSR